MSACVHERRERKGREEKCRKYFKKLHFLTSESGGERRGLPLPLPRGPMALRSEWKAQEPHGCVVVPLSPHPRLLSSFPSSSTYLGLLPFPFPCRRGESFGLLFLIFSAQLSLTCSLSHSLPLSHSPSFPPPPFTLRPLASILHDPPSLPSPPLPPAPSSPASTIYPAEPRARMRLFTLLTNAKYRNAIKLRRKCFSLDDQRGEDERCICVYLFLMY